MHVTLSCIFQGFVHGATGIVRQPIEGAQREGVEGFFKGIDSSLFKINISDSNKKLRAIYKIFSFFRRM